MGSLLLAASNAWILDVAFFVILLLGILFGVWKGFVKQVCKLAGTILSFVVAFMFCIAFKNNLESWFGLETLISNAIHSAQIGGWLTIAISFIALIILVRIAAWMVGVIGTKIAELSNGARKINKALGGLLGLFEAALLLFLALAICYWTNPNGGAVCDYIASSFVVGRIFEWHWFQEAVALPGMIFSRGI